MDNVIKFLLDDGSETEFLMEESFKINGVSYLLVTEKGDEEGIAYILKEVQDGEGEVIYEMVEDDNELDIITDYLNQTLDDTYIDN